MIYTTEKTKQKRPRVAHHKVLHTEKSSKDETIRVTFIMQKTSSKHLNSVKIGALLRVLNRISIAWSVVGFVTWHHKEKSEE